MHNLHGLSAGSPIGFLAAIGMLRVLKEDRGIEVRLGWQNGCAVIEGIDPEKALDELSANMIGRTKSAEFNWADSPRKMPADTYRNACLQMANDPRALSFMAGWATDSVLREGFIAVSRLDMTSGQQKLIKDLRGLAARVSRDHFRSALEGGKYDDQSSFGLDPVALRTHAHEFQAPTKSKTPGKIGLIWLAFESIPLHPLVPVAQNRAQTVGWRRPPKTAYVWPIWSEPLTFDEVRFLRMLPLERLHERPGVTEIWSSRMGKNGKYPWLLPALRER